MKNCRVACFTKASTFQASPVTSAWKTPRRRSWTPRSTYSFFFLVEFEKLWKTLVTVSTCYLVISCYLVGLRAHSLEDLLDLLDFETFSDHPCSSSLAGAGATVIGQGRRRHSFHRILHHWIGKNGLNMSKFSQAAGVVCHGKQNKNQTNACLVSLVDSRMGSASQFPVNPRGRPCGWGRVPRQLAERTRSSLKLRTAACGHVFGIVWSKKRMDFNQQIWWYFWPPTWES